jgi:PAS domain S-box-containing protein
MRIFLAVLASLLQLVLLPVPRAAALESVTLQVHRERTVVDEAIPSQAQFDAGTSHLRLEKWKGAIAAVLAMAGLALVSGIAIHFARINRRLRRRQTELSGIGKLVCSLADSSLAGILVYRGRRCLYVNPVLCGMTGYSSAEIRAMNLLDLVALEHRKEAAENAAAVLRGESVAAAEFRLLNKDGSILWVRSLATKVAFQGRAAVFVTVIDITDGKLAEERLLESEEDLKNAQRLGRIGSWRLDTASDQLTWSDEIFRIFEIDPERFRASYAGFLDLVHPEDRDKVNEAYATSLATRRPYEIKHRLLMPDGRIKIVRELCENFFDASGNHLFSKGIVQDITETELAQEQRFRRLFDAAPIPLVWIGKQQGAFVIEYCNRSFEETYGYTAGEVKILDDLLALALPDPVQRARFVARWRAAFENPAGRDGGGFYGVEEEFVCRNGEHLTVLLSVGRIGEDNWLAAHVDITARKKAEEARENFRRQLEVRTRQVEELNVQLSHRAEEAEAANRAKSAFLNTISHELRTPLGHIIGFTNLMQQEILTDEQMHKLEYIEIAADKLLNMLEEIFDLTSLEAGVFHLENVKFSPWEPLRELKDRFLPMALAKGLDFRVEAAEDLPVVCGDPVRLRQILFAFISNAIKFTERGSVIVAAAKISLDTGTCVIRFEVRDTGIGIAPEVQPRLFSAFVQADASLTRRFEGLGISLAISRMLVRLMDGEVGVDSVEGQGSTFWLTVRFRLPSAE